MSHKTGIVGRSRACLPGGGGQKPAMPDALQNPNDPAGQDAGNEMIEGGAFVLTADGLARLKEELRVLQVDKRREIAERIRESKDHGEFSEDNSELDEVKQEQAIVENRIAELKAILSGAEVLREDDIPTDVVGLGTVVAVKEADRGFEFKIRIVHAVESNPDEDLVSSESPMGQALWGQPAGAKVRFEAPAGILNYEIVSLSR